MLTSADIKLARGIATSAHRGQVDKVGAPYIQHPAMVALLVQLLPEFASADQNTREAAVCTAWLHDVIEDTAVTADNLEAVGLSSDVVNAVVALTRTHDVEPDEYYAIIRFEPIAKLVKTADIASNLAPDRVAQLDIASQERFEVKYSHALKELHVDRSVITKLHKAATAHVFASKNAGRGGRRTVIDLHTHSNRSDGTDSPRNLVLKAHQAGITHLAVTDHDTTAGWDEAVEAADWVGMHLIRGIELTTKNEGRSQHLLAYEPDPTHVALREVLRRATVVREARIPLMVERIAARDPRLSLDDVLRKAEAGTPGRPHIAEALVECGACADSDEAFARYLNPGLDTYVARWAPSIEEAIQTVVAAGGVAVVAHPWARGATISPQRLEQLRACGLRGVEVEHREHDLAARRELAGFARELALVVTGSSDYHGTRKPNQLAEETTSLIQFEELSSMWSTASLR